MLLFKGGVLIYAEHCICLGKITHDIGISQIYSLILLCKYTNNL